jgi:hypothetical protein
VLATCIGGHCGTSNAAKGTACSQNGGVLCDGQATCTQTYSVLRAGDGTAMLTATTAPVFVETYYPIAASMPIATVALPAAVAGSNQPLTLSGTALSEGALSLSVDGHTLALAGYAVAPGSATAGATRVAGRIDAMGVVNTTTRLPAAAFAANSVRAATSVDGTTFWVSGTSTGTGGGIWFAALGAAGTGTQILGTPDNMRMVGVFGGQLYGDSGSSGFTSLLKIGTGEPTTTGQTATPLPGMPTSGASPYGFVFIGTTTLYLADGNSGISRWTLSGTTWTEDTTFTPLTVGCQGVTGWATSTGVVLIAITSAGTGTVQRIDVPTAGSPTATLLETGPTNTEYRGVALAPH